MITSSLLTLSFEQLCGVVEIPQTELVTVVQLGIVSPAGSDPDSWLFDMQMVGVIRRAHRLHRQLEVDWPGIAVAMQLLDRLDTLKSENQQLRRRLQRFADNVHDE